MQRNSGPTFVSTTSNIEIEQRSRPVWTSTTFESKRVVKKERRQEEFQLRSSCAEIRYDRNRKRRSPAAYRIDHHSRSPKQQDCIQRCSSPGRLHGYVPPVHDNPALARNAVNYATKQSQKNCYIEPPQQQQLPSQTPPPNSDSYALISDGEAFTRVEGSFRTERLKLTGRILRKRLNHELDLGLTSVIKSLDAILIAADTVFFCRRLNGHVTWRWSCESDHGFSTEFVGTTTPLYSEDSVRAEIVLSKPLLQSGEYSSNLLLSAFLHELVHCYLFICCGAKAEENGGHTPAFQSIVSLIQSWLSNPRLQLCSMRADLDNFLPDAEDQEHGTFCEWAGDVEALDYSTKKDQPCCDFAFLGSTICPGAFEEDPSYSDSAYSPFPNSAFWAGDNDLCARGIEEVVQAESEWTFTKSSSPPWNENAQSCWDEISQPGWVNIMSPEATWADTPRMGYVSRQERELADTIEGSSAFLPILVE